MYRRVPLEAGGRDRDPAVHPTSECRKLYFIASQSRPRWQKYSVKKRQRQETGLPGHNLFSRCHEVLILNFRRASSQRLYQSYTVKPVLSDHPTVHGKMVVIDRWSLKQGLPETDRFCEALLNSCERCGTHTFDLRSTCKPYDSSRQSGASGGLIIGGGFLANLRCGGFFDSKMGTKQHFSLLLVAKDRENAGRWCKKCRSLVALGRWSPNTVQFEWQTLRA